MHRWSASLVLVVLACGPERTTTPPPSGGDAMSGAAAVAPEPPAADPVEELARLEQRLLAAQRVQLTFEVTARGAMQAELRGLLVVEKGRVVKLDASGSFAGEAGEVSLSADARMVRGTSGAKRFELERPAELDAAVLIGLVRMGVLHNLALAWSARPPDHGEGGVAEWVVMKNHGRAALEGADALHFDIDVAGQPVGEATLLLDADGWPARREQTVRFASGEMQVTERYEAVEITEAK